MQDSTVDIKKMTTPGERLKYIRERLVKLSRAEIQEKHGLSQDTLAAWENGKIKITEKGIERCIKIYNAENLLFSKEWLLTGEGLNPNFSFELIDILKPFLPNGDRHKLMITFLLQKKLNIFDR
ncbi:MAG: helix-turn-helix domain-containing protein [Gammaproteobacteria bacterium]|nr:helix-turn-helix domain-containing protein [Gammaproteobacteria bacterium]